ncbi:MAG: putative toxin-antitoxin system toxin component, PIN family [Terriglobales bacterium]
MTRVVLDTNIVVSAALKAEGNEAAVLGLVAEGSLELWATPAILAEYEDVLRRPALALDPVKVRSLLAGLYEIAIVVKPTITLEVSPHQADNRFLECAEATQADFLTTGNARHFPKRWRGTRVVNARELLAAMARRP